MNNMDLDFDESNDKDLQLQEEDEESKYYEVGAQFNKIGNK